MVKLYHTKQNIVELLGTRIDQVTRAEARDWVLQLPTRRQHSLFTPNSEMLVDAYRDAAFRDILNSGDLNICDSSGPEMLTFRKLTRIPGVDFVKDVVAIAKQKEQRVFLLGTQSHEVLERASLALGKDAVSGMAVGPQYTYHKGTVFADDLALHRQIIKHIQTSGASVLLVALGHKKQEAWIHQFQNELTSVTLAMGVGGSLDFISGKVKRAPKLMRILRAESLYRLCREPRRIARVYKALITFPLLLIWSYAFRRKKNIDT